MSKPFAWSYSSLTSFETCPRRYQLHRVTKEVKDEAGPSGQWGQRVHDALDAYLKGSAPLPPSMAEFQGLADKIKARPGKRYSEQKLALNARFEPTPWFAPDAWVRGILDVSIKNVSGTRLFIGDWKTGKPKTDLPQLRLFAAMGFAHWPAVNEIITAFLWLKSDSITTERFSRNQVPDIWQEFLPRVQRVEEAHKSGKFLPRPSGLCRAHCNVGNRLCEHCGA